MATSISILKIAVLFLFAWSRETLAGEGRIAFVGAVNVPTCRWPPALREPVRAGATACGGKEGNRPSVSRRSLSSHDADNALLGYFLSYGARTAHGGEAPPIITLTYP